MLNQKDQMHPEDRRNLIMFAIAAMVIWLGYEHFLIQPKMAALKQERMLEQQRAGNVPQETVTDTTALRRPREEILAEGRRIPVGNDAVSGSISTAGNRIDDLRLQNYTKKLGGTEKVALLSPSETDFPLYVEFGWMPQGGAPALPGPDTVWKVTSGASVGPDTPVTLSWDNGQGLRFERTVALDKNYMFTVTQRVENHSESPVTLHPYTLVTQQGLPEEYRGKGMHEGPIAYLDGKLVEVPYRKMKKDFKAQEVMASSGWAGITEEYWFTGFVPQQDGQTKYTIRHEAPPTREGRDRFQVDAVGEARTIQPGQSTEEKTYVFAGAKEVKQLEAYERELKIPHFDLAVDFGIYYFMTKPLFHTLHFFYTKVGNMGVAIIMLTVLVRMLVFPLANTSYRSFAKLRKIAPQMKDVRDKYGNDQEKLKQELVKLYETEKVNPAAGCLPILIQIPIFFALYKVMIITIELRHAPFFGWIHDLSAPDPTTIFNLFGLIPWTPPQQLMIGAWPLMMLAVQLLQRNMNPPPQDKMQAFMINVMPFFFCYIMSQFAAGLVVYWTFSGALAMVQQYIIMRSMGVEVHFFTRPPIERELEKQVKEQPAVHPGLEVLEDEVEHAIRGEDETADKPKKKK